LKTIKNTLDEKMQDRAIYKQRVEIFTETSKQFAEGIHALSLRIENVEEGNNRIELKLDTFIGIKEEDN
jgi:hypothetical protein